MQGSWAHKSPYFLNWSSGLPQQGESSPKSGNFLLLGPCTRPNAPIKVKFRTAKRTHLSLSGAHFHVNRCNESPCVVKI